MACCAVLLAALGRPAEAGFVGDRARPLRVVEWVKGEPVDLAKSAAPAVVVVFWNTEFQACIKTVPRISKWQKKFAKQGVVFVAVTNDRPRDVKPFVRQMGDSMDYTVAIDRDRRTFRNYMEAFHQNGIPYAFIVDKARRVAWHGPPTGELEEVLEKVLAGTWDIEAKRAAEQARAKAYREFEQAVSQYVRAATDPEGADEAGTLVRHLLTLGNDRLEFLNWLAWENLTSKRFVHRDEAVAMRAAKRAYELSRGKKAEAAVADTYALALFRDGRIDEAIALQKKAVALAKDDGLAAELKKTLAEFENAKSADTAAPAD